MWEFEPVPPPKVSREDLITLNARLRYVLRVERVLWRRDIDCMRRAADLIARMEEQMAEMKADRVLLMGWMAGVQDELAVVRDERGQLQREVERLLAILGDYGIDPRGGSA